MCMSSTSIYRIVLKNLMIIICSVLSTDDMASACWLQLPCQTESSTRHYQVALAQTFCSSIVLLLNFAQLINIRLTRCHGIHFIILISLSFGHCLNAAHIADTDKGGNETDKIQQAMQYNFAIQTLACNRPFFVDR